MTPQDVSNNTLAMSSILAVLGISFVWSGAGFATGVIQPVDAIGWPELIARLALAIATFTLLVIAAFLPVRRQLAASMVAAGIFLFLGAWHRLTQSLVSDLPALMVWLGTLALPVGMLILATALFHFGRAYRLSRLLLGSYRKIEYGLATRDQLTQLFNRRYFYTAAPELLQSGQNHRQPSVLIVMLLENLPHINQTHGIYVGDAVLSEVGRVLLNSTRRADLAARLGGRRMAIFLPDTPLENGRKIAARELDLCRQVSVTSLQGETLLLQLDISQRIALAGPDESLESLVERCLKSPA